ncbi:hypothetical protein [Qipengyuania sp. JC766]|uniref:hypothetical protein n=1 Tax=Qipengyuania sp. JC766 TaxID=3232139 RepID=UPI00345AC3F2
MRGGRFRHFLAIDWSGAKGQRQKGIALALADAAGGPPVLVERGRAWSRAEVLDILLDLPDDTLVGMDLGIGLPFADCGAYFPGWAKSPPDARALWALVDAVCAGDPDLTASSFVEHPSLSPYFRRQGNGEGAHFRCDGAEHGRGRFRITEQAQAAMGCKPYSNFNLVGAAQVGKSSLTGMRVLNRLAGRVPVWPVDPLPETGSVIVEIYTTIAAMEAERSSGRSKIRTFEDLDIALAALGSPPVGGSGAVTDHASDALLTAAWLRKVAHDPARWGPPGLTPPVARTEGWTFGAI